MSDVGSAPPAPASDAARDAAKRKGRKLVVQRSYSDYNIGQMLPFSGKTAQSQWYFGNSTSGTKLIRFAYALGVHLNS